MSLGSLDKLRCAESVAWGIFVFVALLTLPDYGVSWDEEIRFNQGGKKWDYYAGLIRGEEAVPPADHYPGLHDLLHVALVRVFGMNWIVAGHALSFIFGLAGMWAVRATAVAVGGRFAGIVSLFILILGFPVFYGHLFINPKDIPFFAGYAWSLYFLLKIALCKRVDWRNALGWGLGAGAALGVRIGGFLVWGYAGLLWLGLIYVWWQDQKSPPKSTDLLRRSTKSAVCFAVGAALSVACLFLAWPALHSTGLIAQAGATMETVQDFDWDQPVLFDGHYYLGRDLPFYYLPWMFVITTSIPVLILLVVGGIKALVLLRENPASAKSGQGLAVLVLVFATVFPVAYVILKDATVYNGIRHLLFTLAPLSVLLSVAAVSMFNHLARMSLLIGRVMLVVGFLSLLPSAAYLIKLHPYQYVYYNVLVGGVAGAEGRYELDYWGTAYREAVAALTEYLDQQNLPTGTTFVVGTEHVSWLLTPFVPEDRPYSLEIRRGAGPEADFYLAATIWEAHRYYAGEEIARVERDGALLAVIKDRRGLTGDERLMFFGQPEFESR